jgi:transposase-like protein
MCDKSIEILSFRLQRYRISSFVVTAFKSFYFYQMKKRSYDLEFKRTIVELLLSGKKVRDVCLEYHLGTSMVNRWRREFTKGVNDLKTNQ